jgi:hypothetical protein
MAEYTSVVRVVIVTGACRQSESCLYSKVPSITLIPAGRRLIFLLLFIHFFLAYVKAHSIAKTPLRPAVVQLMDK